MVRDRSAKPGTAVRICYRPHENAAIERHFLLNDDMAQDKIIEEVTSGEYKYGFTTDVQTDIIGKGLNEDVIRTISMKKGEPAWLLEFRLKAYRKWLTMPVPKWAHLNIPDIDFQDISYYAAPKVNNQMANDQKVNEIDPEIAKTFDKLGIPLE